jgi:hypothetical protein
MTLIDILTYSNVPTGENPANLPLDWPYQTKYIYEDTQPISEGWIRLTEQDYNNYITDEDRVARYTSALEYFNNSRQLRIESVVDDNFLTLPPEKIDFRRHLKNCHQ